MAKQRRQEVRPVPRESQESPLNIILVGAACLALGLAIGYYFGKQTSRVAAGPVTGVPSQGTIANPANFIQEEANLKSLVAANPKDVHSMIHLGNLYYDNGRHREAVDWYGRALEIDPGNANVRTDRGTSYWNLGQADAAIDEFKKSIEIAPTHPQTLYNLGVVYLHGKNNPAEARKFWEKLLAANPNYPDSTKIRQQLDALSNTGTSAAPANRGGSGSVEDLLQRMKK